MPGRPERSAKQRQTAGAGDENADEDEDEDEEDDQAGDDSPNRPRSDVFVEWHQIRDLLTVYYFNLKGEFPGNALARNSIGYGRKFHSGIDLRSMVANPHAPTKDELRSMRNRIRRAYEKTLRTLVKRMVADRLKHE